MSNKVKAKGLLNSSKAELTTQLTDLKEELAKLRVQKITGTNSSKLTKISGVRKAIARVLTVIHLKQRQNIREFYKKKHHQPLDLRPKKTRAIRKRLTKHEANLITERTKKRIQAFPRRKYAVRA